MFSLEFEGTTIGIFESPFQVLSKAIIFLIENKPYLLRDAGIDIDYLKSNNIFSDENTSGKVLELLDKSGFTTDRIELHPDEGIFYSDVEKEYGKYIIKKLHDPEIRTKIETMDFY